MATCKLWRDEVEGQLLRERKICAFLFKYFVLAFFLSCIEPEYQAKQAGSLALYD